MEATQLATDVGRLAGVLGELPEPVVGPAFIIVSGLPGTGKTYFCHRLAGRLPLVILESDSLRKALFPSPDYSPQESAQLFRATYQLIERLLKMGIPLVLDATNLAESYRERLYGIADHFSARLIMVRVEAPPGVVRERLKARQGEPGNNSDADWGVYKRMRPAAEKIRRRHYVVDTSRDITPVVDKIVREVNR